MVKMNNSEIVYFMAPRRKSWCRYRTCGSIGVEEENVLQEIAVQSECLYTKSMGSYVRSACEVHVQFSLR